MVALKKAISWGCQLKAGSSLAGLLGGLGWLSLRFKLGSPLLSVCFFGFLAVVFLGAAFLGLATAAFLGLGVHMCVCVRACVRVCVCVCA